jgi:hypothetical protein
MGAIANVCADLITLSFGALESISTVVAYVCAARAGVNVSVQMGALAVGDVRWQQSVICVCAAL